MYRIAAVDSLALAQRLCALETAGTPVPSPGAWLEEGNIGFAALDENGPVGGILLTPCRQILNHVQKYRTEWFYVHPDHRNRGLGRQLAEAAAAEACRHGATTILVAVHPDNQHGLTWSESLPRVDGLGFVVSLDRCGLQ
ncbi:GNAT superfamily N-acetyltransferase [Symbiobacterium terraclitae]|uniref:GNAT superfamily N-acetyltransferase n=1 Tax=Symbiobacterium terraclitae TaxID=557451 RepID=A0ABS4JYZ2_9FIRM|nr:GNAT family N-acetyltransferase [Symbiobacterium terraclitae]MBP2020205.1 GNAT superfamily N-acetyltransferase [Symbiobacterium terraclitae]